MATFKSTGENRFDDYMSPKSAWDAIKNIIPKNKIIWEPFYGDGKSGQYLKELGFNNVIHEPDVDFFLNNKGDIIISNPPFSKAQKVLKRLVELNKPFILILPVSKITTNYFYDIIGFDENKSKKFKILIPRKRIQFGKLKNGECKFNNACNFDCFYYCYDIETLENKPAIIWL